MCFDIAPNLNKNFVTFSRETFRAINFFLFEGHLLLPKKLMYQILLNGVIRKINIGESIVMLELVQETLFSMVPKGEKNHSI